MQTNPKDPLQTTVPDFQKELFNRFTEAADGFTSDDVIGAAVNLLINAIRQAQPTQTKAEKAFDELFGKSKQLLVNHYDMLGRKRGVFPYHQVIQPMFWSESNRF